MATFIADISFRFESESLETVSVDLRRLSDAADDAGFEFVRGKVTAAPRGDAADSGGTSYLPLDPNDR